jgi:ribosome-associated toxin RatA of RatAB toxin-antitoxin module
MKISYHAWVDYKECPKKFNLKNILKRPSETPRNDYFTIYGKLTEKFFQYFCNIWRFTMPYMPPEEIRFKLKKIYDNILLGSVVNWTGPYVTASKDEIFEQSCSDICAIMDSPNQNYFLSTKAEVSIGVLTKMGIEITGRLDFIHTEPLSKTDVVFDGKGTNKIGKNISADQVLFYALLYFFHFKKVPNSLGFFYYRYNTFSPISINLDILNEFRAKLSLSLNQLVNDSEFKATPSPRACKYCNYQTNCQECLADRVSRKRGSKLDFPDLGGVQELSF